MPIPEMTPESAKTLLDDGEGYFYVDVRTVTEFVEGHVPGAVVAEVRGHGVEQRPRLLPSVHRHPIVAAAQGALRLRVRARHGARERERLCRGSQRGREGEGGDDHGPDR